MKSYIIRVFYLGRNYYGSQWQPTVQTIQGELIDALSKWSGKQYSLDMISFSGRTDKGVSSIGQIIYLESEKPPNLDKINSYLPDDIILWAFAEAPSEFSPRFGVLSRHYRYYLSTVGLVLNHDDIRKAGSYLIGTHNYRLLSKPDNGRNTIATILNISITDHRSNLIIDVYGVSFLWKLVRKIVTLLVTIGAGHYSPESILKILDGEDVITGGIEPAPPEGLVFMEAIIPFRLKPSKNAIAQMRKKIAMETSFHNRTLTMLDGLAEIPFSIGKMFS
ncbi:MAG: tRNA pseudouridine(38-40) synthase TruA [Candidatus Thorarchaeota archaeon]